MPQPSFSRRQFLIRTGLIGAAAALVETSDLGLPVPGAAVAPAADAAINSGASSSLPSLPSVLEALAKDTMNGLVAFVVPGPDPYSIAQGVSDNEPGGIAAKGTSFMLKALDDFFPLPAAPMKQLIQALANALSARLPMLPAGAALSPTLAQELDAAVQNLLHTDGAIPLSAAVALFLNFMATVVDPAAANGTFLSPFARLSFPQKVAVFQMLEEHTSKVASLFDGNLPEPLKSSLSGLIKFLAGALLEFAAFGSYSEFGAFDTNSGELSGVPVGWKLSHYLTATNFQPPEGWDEFLGYYRNVSKVTE